MAEPIERAHEAAEQRRCRPKKAYQMYLGKLGPRFFGKTKQGCKFELPNELR